HLQHAVGNEEAADDVAGGGDDGDESEDGGELAFMPAHEHDGTDDRDRVQGVGERHQGCVQQGRNPANHFKSDEAGEHKNKKRVDQVGSAVHLSSGCVFWVRSASALTRRSSSHWLTQHRFQLTRRCFSRVANIDLMMFAIADESILREIFVVELCENWRFVSIGANVLDLYRPPLVQDFFPKKRKSGEGLFG